MTVLYSHIHRPPTDTTTIVHTHAAHNHAHAHSSIHTNALTVCPTCQSKVCWKSQCGLQLWNGPQLLLGASGREIRMRCLLRRMFVKHRFTSPSSPSFGMIAWHKEYIYICVYIRKNMRDPETDRHVKKKTSLRMVHLLCCRTESRIKMHDHIQPLGLSFGLPMQYFWVHGFYLHCMCHHKAGKALMTHNKGSSQATEASLQFLKEETYLNHVYTVIPQ